MENREYTKILFPLILFILIGSALNGSITTTPAPQKIHMHNECYEYSVDADGDNLIGFIQDAQCHDYPYQDGEGESPTPLNQASINPPYANYFDMTVDLVREFVSKECNFNLSNCINTNFENEVQFYCWFSDQIMDVNFGTIFDKFANQNPIGFDDGSLNTFVNTCMVFPPSNMPSTMPNNGDQLNPPIPNNPDGDADGGTSFQR